MRPSVQFPVSQKQISKQAKQTPKPKTNHIADVQEILLGRNPSEGSSLSAISMAGSFLLEFSKDSPELFGLGTTQNVMTSVLLAQHFSLEPLLKG